MGFSRQEYWSGLPFPSPGDLPDPGMEPRSPALAARFVTTEPPEDPLLSFHSLYNLSHGKSLRCGDMLSDPVRTDTQQIKNAKICIFSSEMKELAGKKIIL